MNIKLQVAGEATEINVEGEAPLINRTATSLGNVIEQAQIAELPIADRNVTYFQCDQLCALRRAGSSALAFRRSAVRQIHVDANHAALHAICLEVCLLRRSVRPERRMCQVCSILTTTPNALTATVHDRMPVILRHDAYDLWLDPRHDKSRSGLKAGETFEAGLMRPFPVGGRINQVASDDEACSAPVEFAEPQPGLF